MKTNKPMPSTVKFSPELQKKIDEAAEKTGWPKQEVIRICVAMGLEDLRRIDWDIVGNLCDAAAPARNIVPPISSVPPPTKKGNGTRK